MYRSEVKELVLMPSSTSNRLPVVHLEPRNDLHDNRYSNLTDWNTPERRPSPPYSSLVEPQSHAPGEEMNMVSDVRPQRQFYPNPYYGPLPIHQSQGFNENTSNDIVESAVERNGTANSSTPPHTEKSTSTEELEGPKTKRAKFRDDRRVEVGVVRQIGACWRCRLLKEPCGTSSPCDTCQKAACAIHAKPLKFDRLPCERCRLYDLLPRLFNGTTTGFIPIPFSFQDELSSTGQLLLENLRRRHRREGTLIDFALGCFQYYITVIDIPKVGKLLDKLDGIYLHSSRAKPSRSEFSSAILSVCIIMVITGAFHKCYPRSAPGLSLSQNRFFLRKAISTVEALFALGSTTLGEDECFNDITSCTVISIVSGNGTYPSPSIILSTALTGGSSRYIS